MKTRMTHTALALLGLFALTACDRTGTEPLAEDLTPAETQELEVLENQGALDIALELNEVSNDVAAASGISMVSSARSDETQARVHFAAALEALRAGERRRALEEARAARRLIARAMLAAGGPEAIDALIERIEDLSITSAEDEDVFDDPGAVADELGTLADQARDRLAAADSLGAGERALLGEQRARFRRGRRDHRGDVLPERARLSVALAQTAVSLAERLIAAGDVQVTDVASDVSDRQNRWLAHAKHMLEHAETALANGHFARAVHFAQHARWSALKAVILPGGITNEEIRAMVDLADELYAQAEAVVGDDSPELKQLLLRRAARLIEIGKNRLEQGYTRGVAALWRASVICDWLVD
ncbi:MAG: HEPN domain-containing protein [Gemmatimonadota bacterium]